jgi:hypothetical protein
MFFKKSEGVWEKLMIGGREILKKGGQKDELITYDEKRQWRLVLRWRWINTKEGTA